MIPSREYWHCKLSTYKITCQCPTVYLAQFLLRAQKCPMVHCWDSWNYLANIQESRNMQVDELRICHHVWHRQCGLEALLLRCTVLSPNTQLGKLDTAPGTLLREPPEVQLSNPGTVRVTLLREGPVPVLYCPVICVPGHKLAAAPEHKPSTAPEAILRAQHCPRGTTQQI